MTLRAGMVERIGLLLGWLRSPAAADELWPDERAHLCRIEDQLEKRPSPRAGIEGEAGKATLLMPNTTTGRLRHAASFSAAVERKGSSWHRPISPTAGLRWGVDGARLVVHARYLCTLADGMVERGVEMPKDVAEAHAELRLDAAEADSTRRLGGFV